jgi:WD40 repeat protein
MTDEQGDRVEVLFHQAVDLPPDQRQALLDAACRGEPGLRAAVEKLLADDARLSDDAGARAFLNSPLVRIATDGPTPAPVLPPRVGRYRVLHLVGQGGMASVYEAEQDRPNRRVALKVIRTGLLSPALLKRFEQEVEILGRLGHPGIAQIYEAGIAEDGQPFFAMEFVRGLPLDEYARSRSLTVTDRLSLVARVCDAVQHAHDQGVIHRDLKPSNILVDETGQPKVLDFGVARATDADLLTGAGLTQTGQLLGTPSYMSPEQLSSGSAIDHRTDVYALGVILFELLAHRLPSQVANRPLAEVARLIVEEDAPRLGSINPELRGDVETIVAKALAKDRARRYASAADLAADIRRWLASEPILARPPSALYHLRQFARRHTAVVAAILGIGAALAVGTVVSVLYAIRANHETREAHFQAHRARIAAAVGALAAHDVADAKRHLDAAPEDMRANWEWRHLHSRLDDSSAVMALSGEEVGLLPGHPDGLRAWAWTDAGLRISDPVDSDSKTLPIRLQGRQRVTATQTRRGLRVVVWDGDTAFALFDEAGQVLCRVERPEAKGEPGWVVVSPDGTRLAWVRADGEWLRLLIFDATTGKQTAVCEGHRLGIWGCTFSPDGTRIVSGGEDRMARVWDAATGALVATCRGHESKVLGAAFRPDGARLVTTSSDGTVRQWDAATGAEVEAPYDRHTGEVTAAAYSPDGRWVASAGSDRTIRVWEATGRHDVAVLHGHTGEVFGLAFAPDGRRLASFSRERGFETAGDGTVRVWDLDVRATLPVLRGHTRSVYPVAYSPDGRWLASGSWDTKVRLWDAATGEPCGAPLPHPGHVLTFAYSPDGSWLVTGGDGDDRMRIWDVATARVRKKIQGPCNEAQGPYGNVRHLAVSPDGARVAASAFDGPPKFVLNVTDVSSGQRLFAAPGHVLAYSPDGRWLAVRAADTMTVLLLDARTHETAAGFRGHKNDVYSGAFSRDGRLLAACGADRIVRVWQIDSGACQELPGHTDEVFAVAFHPDGTRLATGGLDRAVWLWDLARGEEVARLPGHTSFIWSLAFSPDGATLASGSGDATVRLWDTAPLKERYKARREAEALRPQAERLVEQLWREKNVPDEVVGAIRADRALSDALRHAALREVLRRSQPVEAAPGELHVPR